MDEQQRIKLFGEVFAPKKGEKILFLYDLPHDNIKDSSNWQKRREYIKIWYKTFVEMGKKSGFLVDIKNYPATGIHNTPITKDIIQLAKNYNLIIAMTEYSASSSLKPLCKFKNLKIRVVSMPEIIPDMEKSAFSADYSKIKIYAKALQKIMNDSIGAEILFSTKHKLYIDLRNREAEADCGICLQNGTFINFPGGETYEAPYEATEDEIKKFGKSKTQGTIPFYKNKQLILLEVKENKIIEVVGDSNEAKNFREFLEQNSTHRNIAELGFGCNQKAIIRGLIIEDEKVGLHIAYGKSTHLGGKIDSDTHEDIVFAKGCPIEGKEVNLIDKEGNKRKIIENSQLRYELLE